jgi:hypothetical protein
MTSTDALKRQITALMVKAEKTFEHDGVVYLPQTVVDVVEGCWVSLLHDRDHARTEHLLRVAEFLIARNRTKFKADPARWITRQQELAA